MTNQEIFDKVVTHLLTQKTRAVDEDNTCKYRINNLKCAIGCLIEDEKYLHGMEYYPDNRILQPAGMINRYFKSNAYTDDNLKFMFELQQIHDSTSLKNEEDLLRHWKYELNIIAGYYKLDKTVLLRYQ